MGTLGGDGMLTLGDGGQLTLGDDRIAVVGLIGGTSNSLSGDAVDWNLLIKISDNLVKAVAVSFWPAKRGNIERDFKTSASFVTAKRISSFLPSCGDFTLWGKSELFLRSA